MATAVVPKEGRTKEGPTVFHVQMIEQSGWGAALPSQVAGTDAGGCSGRGFRAGADGAVESRLGVHHLLVLVLGVEHHLLLLLGGHVRFTREVARGRGRRRRRLVVPDVVVGQEPGEDAVGAGVGAGGAGPGREEVLAELAEHRAGRRSVPQQPGRGHRRLHREVEVLGHRRAVHQLAQTVQILHKNKKEILAICSYKKHSFEQLYGAVSKANCTSSSSSRNWLKIFKIKGFSIMETV